MKKYFTKEYIKECSCGEIKGLRKDCWIYGDYISFNRNKPRLVITEVESILEEEIFIPRSDQLDEEIVKILKDKYEYYKWEYIIKCCWIGRSHTNWVCILYDKNHGDIFTEVDANPLIAKIKLLKQLLK